MFIQMNFMEISQSFFSLSLSSLLQGESVKYFLDNVEKLGEPVRFVFILHNSCDGIITLFY